MATKVSIVNIKDFNTEKEAIIEAIKLIEKDFSFDIHDCKKILLKPNLLRATENACTRPEIIEGVIAYLTQENISMENVYIGDSPGQINTFATNIAKKIGIFEICEEAGIKFVDFEREVPVNDVIDGAVKLKDYYVSKIVKECDLLINMPRLKTHGEATITGAIKNYWGIIPGGLKAKFHLLGKTPLQFGEVLADNFAWVVQNKPNRFTVLDLKKVMYGTMGPVSGPLKDWNLILAGTDELALDLIALEIGKFNGLAHVPHIKSVHSRGLGIQSLDDIDVVGLSLEEAKKITPKFKVPGKSMTRFASMITGRIFYKVTKRIPTLNKKLCQKCGLCAEICPANAINFEKGSYPEYNRKKCISCLCCMEACPYQAIIPKKRGFKGLFHSY